MTPTVLVVDDEVNIAHFVQDFLEDNGFHVLLTHTGREGLKAAMETLPDLIILDVDLPDLSGYEVCRLHAREERAPHQADPDADQPQRPRRTS